MSKSKKKGVKLALTDFLADGSWAAESAGDLQPATATTSFQSRMTARISDADIMADLPRSSGESRQARPIPTSPPYTAFIGNLSRDANDDDLKAVFADLKMERVKIVRDSEGVAKGFAYIDFESGADLEKALAMSGQLVKNMPLRVDVSERKEGMRADGSAHTHFDDSKFQGAWRRDTPIALAGRPPMRSGGSSFSGSGDGLRIERRSTPLAPSGQRSESAPRYDNDVRIERRATPLQPSAAPAYSEPRGRRDDDVRIERRATPLEPQGVRDYSAGRSPRRMDDDVRIERRATPLPPQVVREPRPPMAPRHNGDDIKIERRSTPLSPPKQAPRVPHVDPDVRIERRATPLEPARQKSPRPPAREDVRIERRSTPLEPRQPPPAAREHAVADNKDMGAWRRSSAKPVDGAKTGGTDQVKEVTDKVAAVSVSKSAAGKHSEPAPPPTKNAWASGGSSSNGDAASGPWRRAAAATSDKSPSS